ncbi:MAG: glycosyltransferase family protein [Planctomycetaceae bacterium]|jgi:spore coat polysaccharide biosynthesis protein SpsF|nr:glycosyltransferase family protein [Rhodospirillales bacterium]MBT4844498.1 glycosyltransferase family protein [Planctomycetaceae bacterium]MBT4039740.1 glycosyltransferase family protein [Rhodospirillales bacterium]MBT4626143.1 glycosyltransferase family protein [Rhodospirillales bacterium]MBT5350245.1 glycosyltransferase family protein [Rhodospirillales bacterium]
MNSTPSGPVVCTIEARMGSTRLPGKILKPLAGQPMLSRIIERIGQADSIDKIAIVTATSADNDPLVEFAEHHGVDCYRGSEDDVLDRVAAACEEFAAETIVSLTGDNPFIDPVLIDDMVSHYYTNQLDYLTTTHMAYAENWPAERTFPRGVTAQVVSGKAFLEVNREAVPKDIREHATMAIYRRDDNRYRVGAFNAEGNYAGWRHPELRMTVDLPEDFELAEILFENLLKNGPIFSTGDAIALLSSRPDLQAINAEFA